MNKVCSILIESSGKDRLILLGSLLAILAVLQAVLSEAQYLSILRSATNACVVYFGFAAIVNSAFGRYRSAIRSLLAALVMTLIV